MALSIEAYWHKPIELRDRSKDGLLYDCPRIEDVPPEAGVYLFGRQWGDRVEPLYIGRSGNLRLRLTQHLDSVRLMSKLLRDARTGLRFFMFCTVSLKPGQEPHRVLQTLESALIAFALGEGYELLQKQGTKRPNHLISFSGNRTSESLFPRVMRISAS